MAVSINQIEGEPIVVATITPPLDNIEELDHVASYVAALKNQFDGIIYRIDMFKLDTIPFSVVVEGMAKVAATRTSTAGTFADPRVQGVMVGNGAVPEMISTSFKQDQYGALNIPLFQTLDEAMEFVHNHMLETA